MKYLAAWVYAILLLFCISPVAPALSQTSAPSTKSAEMADISEFRGMAVGMAEPDFQVMVADRGLRYIASRSGAQMTYQVYQSDGENLVAIFSAGICRSIAPHAKDASCADTLFNGLGKAAKALQITARVLKTTWKTGDNFCLTVDLHNAGDVDVPVFVSGYDGWEIGVDDQWYRPTGASTGLAHLLAPGETWEGISVPPTWIPAGSNAWHFKLEPGNHTVRVRAAMVKYSGQEHVETVQSNGSTFRVLTQIRGLGDKPEWAVSNSIEITVLEPEKPTP
jgi:hypothetical protein